MANKTLFALMFLCSYALVAIRSTKDYVRKNNLFMQNKANFRKVKLNVNKVLTKDYDRMDTWSIRKTKPIQSQLKPIQSQLKPILCQNKANSNPTCRGVASGEDGNKPNLKILPQRVGRTRAGHTRSCFGHLSKVVILFAE